MNFYDKLLKESQKYLSFFDFGPEKLKECFSWMQKMCRSIEVHTKEHFVYIKVLIEDNNGNFLTNRNKYSPDFEEKLMDWQFKAANVNSNYFPIIRREKYESIVG